MPQCLPNRFEDYFIGKLIFIVENFISESGEIQLISSEAEWMHVMKLLYYEKIFPGNLISHSFAYKSRCPPNVLKSSRFLYY